MSEMKRTSLILFCGLFLAVLMAGIPALSSASDMVNRSSSPVCVGKVQLSFPDSGRVSWSQDFDYSKVERMREARTKETFWNAVAVREAELRAMPHDFEDGRLSRAERIGDYAAILLYREHAASKRAYRMQRYLWLDGQGYMLQSTGAMRPQFTENLAPFIEIFSRIHSSAEAAEPAMSDFCIDGAVVRGDIGRISAGVSVGISGWNHVALWAGATEGGAASGGMVSPRDELRQRQRTIRQVRRLEPDARSDPEYPRDFDVLRSAARKAGRLDGEEVVWRERLNNGASIYVFLWRGQLPGTDHVVTVGMDVGDQYQPGEQPPAEDELIALWDETLGSLRSPN